jgi:hypothetical protein
MQLSCPPLKPGLWQALRCEEREGRAEPTLFFPGTLYSCIKYLLYAYYLPGGFTVPQLVRPLGLYVAPLCQTNLLQKQEASYSTSQGLAVQWPCTS